MKHTPLPWVSKYVQVADKWEILGKEKDGSEKWIGVMIWGSEPEDEANNEFILRACNSHYELVEACKEAIDLLRDEWEGTSPNSIGNKTIRQLEQAIAKAEGEGE